MDTPAFQHLLSFFPQLTLRQRPVAQQELTAPTTLPHSIPSYRHAVACPHCQADVTQLAPWGWSRGLLRIPAKLNSHSPPVAG